MQISIGHHFDDKGVRAVDIALHKPSPDPLVRSSHVCGPNSGDVVMQDMTSQFHYFHSSRGFSMNFLPFAADLFKMSFSPKDEVAFSVLLRARKEGLWSLSPSERRGNALFLPGEQLVTLSNLERSLVARGSDACTFLFRFSWDSRFVGICICWNICIF